MSDRPARVLLAGHGRVGRAFADLARAREDLDVGAVVTSTGPTVSDLLGQRGWDVVADATPTDLCSGGPALVHARAALSRGISFATAAKGPLVVAYRELVELAARTGAGFRFSAATGAGLPTVDLAEFCLAGARVLRVEGILNGTANYVLDRMLEADVSMDAALAEARQLGIADGDGRLDVSGADTAAKLIGIANAVLGGDLMLDDVPVTGIQGETPASLRAARDAERIVRLVGRAWIENGRVRAEVSPIGLDRSHPLAGIRGPEKCVSFVSDTMGRLTVMGGRSDPVSAGAALLRDVLLLTKVGARI